MEKKCQGECHKWVFTHSQDNYKTDEAMEKGKQKALEEAKKVIENFQVIEGLNDLVMRGDILSAIKDLEK